MYSIVCSVHKHLLKCGCFPCPLFMLVCRALPLVWSPSPVHFNIYIKHTLQYPVLYEYKLQVGRPENSIFLWPAFVTRLLTPRSRKSGYGLLLGCRSGLDFGTYEKTFFWQSSNPKTGRKSSLSVLVHGLNRSGVVELVEREPLIIAGVENGVTKFSPKRQKTENAIKFSKKNGSGKQFSVGNFHFLAAGKLTFLGGGITSKLASQWPSWGIYKHAPPSFWRKRRLLYWKKGGQIKTFSWGGQLVFLLLVHLFRFLWDALTSPQGSVH